MNHQLLQQVFAAINGAPIAEIKEWRKFITDAGEKLTTRTTGLVDQQKKALEDILVLVQDITPEAKTEKKTRGSYRLSQDLVLATVDNLLAEKTAVKIDDVMQCLVNDGFDGTRHSLKAHMDHLGKKGLLVVSRDPECKLHFPTNLYHKP